MNNNNDDFYSIGDGQFLSQKDPEFWRKLLHRRPHHPEALYRVSLLEETEARELLEKFNETQEKEHLNQYKEKAKSAVERMAQSLSMGYLPADRELKRMRQEHDFVKLPVLTVIKEKGVGWLQMLLMCLLAFLIGVLIAGAMFLLNRDTTEKPENVYIYIPYILENKVPEFKDERDVNERFITVSTTETDEQVISKMLGVVQQLQVKDSTTKKRIYAVSQTPNGKIQMGVAIFDPVDGKMRVHLTHVDKDFAKVWETTTVLRSAVLQFQKVNGYVPRDLDDLTLEFPENFLTGIPMEPITGKRVSMKELNGEGGWFYRPFETEGLTDEEVEEQIQRNVCPNLLKEIAKPCGIPFDPLSVHIDKEKNLLSLMSGNQIIVQYPVALGRNDQTPEGTFSIAKKVTDPNQGTSPNPYGTRGMELSDPDYAIHGTNSPTSIGKNVSAGCIRMKNEDIESLYAMVPKNTPVVISKTENTDGMPSEGSGPSGKGTPTPNKSVPGNGGNNPKGEPSTPMGTAPSETPEGGSTPPDGQPPASPPNSGKGTGSGPAGEGEGTPYPLPSSPKENDPDTLYGWAG